MENKGYDNRQYYYKSLDIAKFVLSLIVVSIHTVPQEWVIPYARIAVPLFFMISAFLFFQKKQLSLIKRYFHFAKRLLLLNLMWSVVLSPFILYEKYMAFRGGAISAQKSIVLILKDIFFNGFGVSWYFSALLIGVAVAVIVVYLSKNNNAVLLTIGVFLYCICCFASNYYNVFDFSKWLDYWPVDFQLSFPASIIWIALGKVFAEGFRIQKKVAVCFLTISLFGLYFEYFVIRSNMLSVDNDCYFMLIPCAIMIFSLLLQCKFSLVSDNIAVFLRKMSTSVFCVHMPMTTIVCVILKYLGTDLYKEKGIVIFCSNLALSICFSVIAIYMSNKKRFRILKLLF